VPHRRSADSRFTGVDACPGGWVAVTLSGAGTGAGAVAGIGVEGGDAGTPPAVTVTVARTLDGLALDGVTGIDMPLGLLATGWRTADLLARRALGRRGSCVFAIPPRPVWEQPAYANANQGCRELTGRGMSIQAWGLRRKLLEADEFRRAAAPRLYEVHPELSFAALGGGTPLADSKHTRAGLAARRALLAQAGIVVPPRVAGAAEDDLLDAAAVAWSAARVAAGAAVTLNDPAQRADDGREIAIRY
jgi:predicted RNase H-like nuclease